MKEYVRPVALIEEFVANSYVAACNNSVSVGNEMKCINPEHEHGWNYSYTFATVWVEAASSTCDIKVTADSPRTQGSNIQPIYRPAKNTYVYSLNGPLQCDTRASWTDLSVNMPSSARGQGEEGPCYGAYEHDGSFTASVIS